MVYVACEVEGTALKWLYFFEEKGRVKHGGAAARLCQLHVQE